ncbi:hypothetical protein H8R18_01145 [Nanchangia anserum]|uniref:Uncharacterized protein n=1 Tax=Nanchangia anserum TaxID=2692125 RepID=A0A8I0KWB5_9ACTO|nr:hypothetical protein [Nanchangia anserum]MBD3689844.1 hypothetical protein [Nanchangia anserum]QOX82010.1 hypothetical protein H8R18_01145 [Nanchangia anserum]
MSAATDFRVDVAKFIGRTRYDLPAINDAGERCVIALLGSDPAAELFAQLKSAGGCATVFVKRLSGTVDVLAFTKPDTATAATRALTLDGTEQASTVEALAEMVEKTPGGLTLHAAALAPAGPVRVHSHARMKPNE